MIQKGHKIQVKNMIFMASCQQQRPHIIINQNRNNNNNNNNNNSRASKKRPNNNNMNFGSNNSNNNNKFSGLINRNNNNNDIRAGTKPQQPQIIPKFLKKSVNKINQIANKTFNIKDSMDKNNNTSEISLISSISPISSPPATSDDNIGIIVTNEDVDVQDAKIKQGIKRGKQPDM